MPSFFPGEPGKQSAQFLAHLPSEHCSGCAPIPSFQRAGKTNDTIYWHRQHHPPEQFAANPPDAVADHRLFCQSPGNHDTKTGAGRFALSGIQRKVRRSVSASRAKNGREVILIHDTPFARKTSSRTGLHALHGQTLATLGATRIQHSTTTPGCHAGTKTVCPFAAHNRRLISTFHDDPNR